MPRAAKFLVVGEWWGGRSSPAVEVTAGVHSRTKAYIAASIVADTAISTHSSGSLIMHANASAIGLRQRARSLDGCRARQEHQPPASLN